jgi:Family of unknown function (DUF5923)
MTSTAVNRPTDIKQKEQDVNQKLQLYGIINGEPFLYKLSIHMTSVIIRFILRILADTYG